MLACPSRLKLDISSPSMASAVFLHRIVSPAMSGSVVAVIGMVGAVAMLPALFLLRLALVVSVAFA
jgi:hypothetical protein